MDIDEDLEKIMNEIYEQHQKIIDDFCKSYLAQIYQETGTIKPGDYILCVQVPTFHIGEKCMVRKYWFERKEDV